jgi:hypothetical protein
MKPGRILMDTQEWLVGTTIDWNTGSAKFNGIKRVACRLLNFNISGDRRDCDHADVRGAESHDEGDSIVRRNVGVDQEGARHPRRIANQGNDEVISTKKNFATAGQGEKPKRRRFRFGTAGFADCRGWLGSLEWRFKASARQIR